MKVNPFEPKREARAQEQWMTPDGRKAGSKVPLAKRKRKRRAG